MSTTCNDSIFQIAVSSAVLSTAAVLVVDVLWILLVQHSLCIVGECLTTHRVLKSKSVCLSLIWVEALTGCTPGPRWFRHTQALLKMMVVSASIVLSLSLNGVRLPCIEQLQGQTILVQKPRSLQNTGLGRNKPGTSLNFSQELAFMLELGACPDHDESEVQLYNMRAKWGFPLNV